MKSIPLDLYAQTEATKKTQGFVLIPENYLPSVSGGAAEDLFCHAIGPDTPWKGAV